MKGKKPITKPGETEKTKETKKDLGAAVIDKDQAELLVDDSKIKEEKEDKIIKIKEILESDVAIPTYLKSEHGLILKEIFAQLGSIDKINSYINMLCGVAFSERKKPERGFNIVIDHEFFMGDLEKIKNKDENEIKKIKERMIGFIKDILGSEDKRVFLLGPVNIDFLAEMASKLKLSDKSEEEIKTILSSKITHMQREIWESTILKIEAYKSINIHTGTNDKIQGIIENKLLEIDCTKLEDTNFVAAEFFENDNRLDTSKGIEKAFDIYTHSPDKKLIIVSAIPFEEFQEQHKNNTKLEFLLTQKNIRFLWLYDPIAFKEFKEETGFSFDADEEIIKSIKPRPIKTFNPKILENLFEPDYLSTITFNMGLNKPDNTEGIMKESLKKINLKNIKDSIFIEVFAIYKEGQWLQSMEGLDIAMEELQNNPDKKIILTTPCDIESLKAIAKGAHKTDKLNFLLGRKNVKFFEYGTDEKALETIFDEPGDNIETNETILSTMHFYESRGWNPYLKDFFTTLDLNKLNLKNSIVVDLRPDSSDSRDDMDGLKIASEALQQHPDAKIILCSLIPTDIFQNVIKGKKPEQYLKALLEGKNVRLIQSSGGNSMTKEEVLKQFEGMYDNIQSSEIDGGGKTFQELAEIESEVAFQKLMEGEISHFLHDAGHWLDDMGIRNVPYEEKLEFCFFKQPQEEKTEKRLEFENRLIALLQIQHPSFKLLPRENNLQWIIDMYKYSRAQGLPEGTRFEGVYVDWDGCLYDNKNLKFNQKIIDMIKEWEAKGYVVTIRTGGNLQMKQTLLDEAGLKYKIQDKTDYKGGIVEVAIDNDSQELLLAKAKIKSETHIKV